MKRALILGSIALIGALAMVAGLVWSLWADLHRPFEAHAEAAQILIIEPGLGAGQILGQLETAGVIESAYWTRAYLSRYLGDPLLQAGEYAFVGPMSATEVLGKLMRGDVLTHDVTLVEGLDMFETAGHLAASGFGDESEFLRLVQNADLIASLDPDASSLEGYLFPDTYSFARGTGESEIVATLVRSFLKRFNDDVLPLLGGTPAGSMRDLVTLASIVEKETSRGDERPVVAGVYSNRLARRIGLFADPTVIYGLKLAGTWDGNLRRRDLEADTPYNTYRFAGLPPGPICSPGVASLKAAAQPAEVPYLYFVSRNDGSHVFSRTLAEHNRNVETWQRRYWRQRWARERAAEQGPE